MILRRSLIFFDTLLALPLLFLGPPFSPQFSARLPEFLQQFERIPLQVSHVVQVSHTETLWMRITGLLCWPLLVHFEGLWVCVTKDEWNESNYSGCEKGGSCVQGPGVWGV